MDKPVRLLPPGDLLDHVDSYGRQLDYEWKGYAVWVVARAPRKMHRDGTYEYRHLRVLYDDEAEVPVRDRTNKRWVVSIVHHRSYWEDTVTGWGNSRTVSRKLKTRSKYTDKRFGTREEADQFATKLKDLIARMVQKDED